MVIVYICVLEVMLSCINGHLVTHVMMTEVKVVCGKKKTENNPSNPKPISYSPDFRLDNEPNFILAMRCL